MNENMLAKNLGRPIKEITSAMVDEALIQADTNKDGQISKSELNAWIVNYMRDKEEV